MNTAIHATKRRRYIRHPSDMPIEVVAGQFGQGETESLHNIGYGGLSLTSKIPLRAGDLIKIRILCIQPVFEAMGKVAWCRRKDNHFDVGIEFRDREDMFRVRMVEQLCHIEHYKKEVLAREGRVLSNQEAALEWISKYATHFP